MHSQRPAPFQISENSAINETEWLSWMEEFQGYVQSVGFDKKSKKRRRDLLLRCVGPDVRRLIGQCRQDVILDYDWLLTELRVRFQSPTNNLYHRFCFRQCLRKQDEPFEQFVYRLKTFAQECNFADIDLEIMDHVIDKCADDELRHSLLRQSGVDLSKMVELAIKHEEMVRDKVQSVGNDGCENTKPVANNRNTKKKNKKNKKKNAKSKEKEKPTGNKNQNESGDGDGGTSSQTSITNEVLDTYVII